MHGVHMHGMHMHGVHMHGVHTHGVHMHGVHMHGLHTHGVHAHGVHMHGVHTHEPTEHRLDEDGACRWTWRWRCGSALSPSDHNEEDGRDRAASGGDGARWYAVSGQAARRKGHESGAEGGGQYKGRRRARIEGRGTACQSCEGSRWPCGVSQRSKSAE